MPADTWTDIIPAIPLAHGVPVIGYSIADALLRGVAHESESIVWDDGVGPDYFDTVRVDLDDPQGFAYALRWLVRQRRRDFSDEHQRDAASLGNAWLWNEVITDADRIALARALAAIV